MRLFLTKAGLDNVRLNLIKGVCDTRRECGAWEEAGRAYVPSTALPGKFNVEVGCDLMFYKQEHKLFHIIDRCIRYATGMELLYKTLTSTLDAYYQSWMQFEPAKVFYSDEEGAFDNDAAEAVLEGKGIELRIRARGQRATTIEAIRGRLRHVLHVMESELK
eukprot:5035455-Pyramimonas_sp.AAC.1